MKIYYPNLSFCIPVYNEEDILIGSIIKIEKGLTKILGGNNFEIIIVENGSTDNTLKILKSIKSKIIRVYSTKEKGSGNAFKLAISKAKYNYLLLSAIDLPFSFSDLKNIKDKWKYYDLIFGSKAHKNSIINTSFKRKLYSYFYRIFIKMFFNLKIDDTQGSVFLNKKKVYPIVKYCDANNAFFTTQLAIRARSNGLKMTEVAVNMENQTYRQSKYSFLKDGTAMAIKLVKEYFKLKSEKIHFI